MLGGQRRLSRPQPREQPGRRCIAGPAGARANHAGTGCAAMGGGGEGNPGGLARKAAPAELGGGSPGQVQCTGPLSPLPARSCLRGKGLLMRWMQGAGAAVVVGRDCSSVLLEITIAML